ncbi:MAG: helix-turn-helix domain-containing protein [Saprospiraceae bacterium]|jgi:HTH-type transcriptional regulator/antitoxin HigA|nr:helix-turn-helix domain-containing protein [Saprospiraceae bacterium]MBP6238596.1 helix-turn-helix domain-containing protein [Saprospiraceae bacterium]MBP6568869.1 helix-turn-helix domain-containing protein [Saprospiraceae bacterium]
MLKVIKNELEHEQYLVRAYTLMQMDLQANSAESDELEVLSLLIQEYEHKTFIIEPPNPIDAILFRMDQLGVTKSDLAKILGSKSRVSEIFNGKRKLSLEMIRKLNVHLGISAQSLITDYDLVQA